MGTKSARTEPGGAHYGAAIWAKKLNHAKYDIPAGISAAGNTECGAIIALSGRKFGLRKVRALMRVCTSNSGFALGDCAGIWGPESSTCAPAFSEFFLRAASGNREAEFALHTHAQSTRKTTTPEFEVKPLLPTKFRAHGSRASESGIRKLAGRLRSRACPGAGASDQRRADAVAADQPRETSCRWLASPATALLHVGGAGELRGGDSDRERRRSPSLARAASALRRGHQQSQRVRQFWVRPSEIPDSGFRIAHTRALVSGWTNDLRFRIPDSDLSPGRCSKERPVSGFRIPRTSWST